MNVRQPSEITTLLKMIVKQQFKFTQVFALTSLLLISAGGLAQLQLQAGRIDARVVDSGASPVLEGPSVLHNDGFFVWGGSVIKGEDGKYHMLYSRWPAGPEKDPFGDGWLTSSEIAYAVSDRPDGDFEFVKVVLRGRMHEGRSDAWDAQSVHNPHIKRFNGKYYLYHTGSKDLGVQPAGSPGVNLSKRNRIQQSQKLGVIEFKSIDDLLAGNFRRPDTPLLSPLTRVKNDNILNPSPKGTKPLPDNIIVVNPSVVYRPSDNKYLLFFKGNLYDPYWKGAHGVALSDSPTGPFEPLDQFVFNIKDSEGKIASAEDPYVWFSQKDNWFYAVFKDFTGKFTGKEPGLAIMKSRDGVHWAKMLNPMFVPLELQFKEGTTVKVNRLERPQLLISENGTPRVLYAACSLSALNDKKDGSSFNVQIPLWEGQ